jgi:hypothetical protein
LHDQVGQDLAVPPHFGDIVHQVHAIFFLDTKQARPNALCAGRKCDKLALIAAFWVKKRKKQFAFFFPIIFTNRANNETRALSDDGNLGVRRHVAAFMVGNKLPA